MDERGGYQEVRLAHSWWTLVLRGVVALCFGLVALLLPGVTLGTLVLMFGSFALVGGVFAVIAALRSAVAHERWGALLLEGLVSAAAGVVTFLWPGLTAYTLTIMIGAWAVVSGVLQVMTAIRLRRIIRGEWLLALGGVLAILFGGAIFVRPLAVALAVVWLIGCYAVASGVLLIVLGLSLRRHRIPSPSLAL